MAEVASIFLATAVTALVGLVIFEVAVPDVDERARRDQETIRRWRQLRGVGRHLEE